MAVPRSSQRSNFHSIAGRLTSRKSASNLFIVGGAPEMSRVLGGQRKLAVAALIFISAFLSAAPVAAEIFKCVAKDGTPLYQNFPCNIDSLGLLSPNPLVAPSTPTLVKTPSMSGAPPPEASRTQPVNVASAVKSPSAGELRVGMTADELTALLGDPEDIVEDEPGSGGRVSTWRYADGTIVQLDNKHRVIAVQR
jgi:hypothetical protein